MLATVLARLQAQGARRWLAGLIFLTLGGAASADVLLDEAQLVAATGVASDSEFSFTASTAQPLIVTLTDDQQPAAFQSLQFAVTLGNTLVGSASISGSSHAVTVSLPAATGTYVVHVVGTPASLGFGSFGSFSVCTAPQATPSACIAADSYSGNIQAPSTGSTSGQSTLTTTFTATVAGTYSVTLTDDSFPAPLTSLVAGISQGSTPVAGPITPGAAPTQVTLAAGTQYTLLVAANANTTLLAGLYGIQIVDPTGATVFARTLPVGELASSQVASNPAAQTLTLSVNDLAYPSALAGLGAAVTNGAQLLGSLTASGTKSLMAPVGTLELWHYAVAGAQPGAYTLGLAGTSGALYSTTQVVNPANSAAATSFAFTATLPTAGTYTFAVNDFQFPATLQTLSSTLAQSGTSIQPGADGSFTAAAGPVIVVVNATAASGGIGVFGVTIASTGSSPTLLLNQTQGVGAVFASQTVTAGVSGQYDVALADLGFPAAFENLAVVVSSGGKPLRSIFGAGTVQVNVTPGDYIFSIVATPGSQNYGLYGLSVSASAPTVTLTSNTTTVTAGQSVQLSWSTTNATACMASGATGWSGSQPISSSGVPVAISANPTTLTLSCTGAGGTASQSVTVTTTPAAKSSGGGGSLDLGCLLLLSTALGGRLWRARSARAA